MKKNPKRNQTNERKRPSCQKFTLFKEEFSPTQLRAFPQKTCVICTFLNKTETHKQTKKKKHNYVNGKIGNKNETPPGKKQQ